MGTEWCSTLPIFLPEFSKLFYMFFHFSIYKQWQILKTFTPAGCRIIYFANTLYLGRVISKQNRAFSGFSLCEYLFGIWVNYNFVPVTCNVLSHSSEDEVTTEITFASLSLIICNIKPNGTRFRIMKILIHSKKKANGYHDTYFTPNNKT